LPRAMFTIVRISSTVTCPLPSQSPTHGVGAGVLVGVAVTVGVLVAVGVDVGVGGAVAVLVDFAVSVGVVLGVCVGVPVVVGVGASVFVVGHSVLEITPPLVISEADIQTAAEIIDQAIQLHGALGVSQHTPLAHMYALQRTLRLADGPDEVHHLVVGRNELRMREGGEDAPTMAGVFRG